ncbi:MAG: ADOP family duplicated permease [Vicinamibacteria bacterium]
MDGFAHDLRFAQRALGRRPGFALVALLTLAFGIGGSTALFTTAWAAVGRPLPFADEDRLVRVYLMREGDADRYSLRAETTLAIRERAKSFAELAAQRFTDVTLQMGAAPEQVTGIAVDAGWARTLKVEPILGRSFTADEYAAGDDAPAVLVSHGFWRDRLGADPRALGSTLLANGVRRSVVGVMPPGFRYPYAADLWLPLRLVPGSERSWSFNVVGRVRPGVSVAQAAAELKAISRPLAIELPALHRDATLVPFPLRETLVGEGSRTLLALFGATGFLLLIVCANLANLLLVRTLGRRRELAVRRALGATRLRQMRLVLAESLTLALAGGSLGLLLARFAIDGLGQLLPTGLSHTVEGPALDAAALGWAVLASLASGLALGAAPALGAARVDLREALTSSSRGVAGSARWLDGFAVAQVGLSLVLLSGAALMARDLARQQRADLGYAPEGLQLFSLAYDGPAYTPARRIALVHAVEEGLRALPGVEAAGSTNLFPSNGGTTGIRVRRADLDPAVEAPIANMRLVTPGFFEAMGLAAIRGRLLDERDGPASERVAVLSQSLARKHFRGEDPLGRALVSVRAAGDVPLTVVGVVPDVREATEIAASMYLAQPQEAALGFAGRAVFVVRARGGAIAESALRRAVAEVDGSLPVYQLRTAEMLASERLAPARLSASLFGGFAGFGLLLCCLGVYGVLGSRVAAETREIAIRLALGADPGRILRGVLTRGLALVTAGALAGFLATLALRRVAQGLVTEIDAADPWAASAALTALLIAGLLACAGPARRALRTDPVEALRDE